MEESEPRTQIEGEPHGLPFRYFTASVMARAGARNPLTRWRLAALALLVALPGLLLAALALLVGLLLVTALVLLIRVLAAAALLLARTGIVRLLTRILVGIARVGHDRLLEGLG